MTIASKQYWTAAAADVAAILGFCMHTTDFTMYVYVCFFPLRFTRASFFSGKILTFETVQQNIFFA